MTKKERRRKSDANKLHMLNIINKLFWLISLIYCGSNIYVVCNKTCYIGKICIATRRSPKASTRICNYCYCANATDNFCLYCEIT